jgi:hypothetical protein
VDYLMAELVEEPTYRELSLNPDWGTFTYTPGDEFPGTDSFTYQAYDGEDYSNDATVTINVAPSVAADNASVTVDEGQTAANTGTFSDPGDDVAVTASVEAVTQDGTESGTWSWSFDTTDGPDESQTVTITATDSDGALSTTTFVLTVNNVAPSIAVDNALVTVEEGQTAANTGTFSDPGDDVVDVTASVGTVAKDGTQSGTWSWSFDTTDGPEESQTVTITATDSDGAVSTTTFELTVTEPPAEP